MDASLAMLKLPNRVACRYQVQADAAAVPLRDESLAAVVAFLYDPFNGVTFYEELSRILRPGGVFVGTLPSVVWGKALRREERRFHKAVFVKDDGSVFSAPSFLMEVNELVSHLRMRGLNVTRTDDLYLPETVTTVSPDILRPAGLLGLDPYRLPVVQLIVAEKM
jgi:SAM-dependent methyltransferase